MADGPPEPQGDDDAPPPPESSFNRRRSIIGGIIALVFLVIVFARVIPQVGDYQAAFDLLGDLRAADVLVLAGALLVYLLLYGLPYLVAAPGIRFSESEIVNNSRFVIGNGIPGGGALGLAVGYAQLTFYRVTPTAATAAIGATGVWASFVTLTLPITGVAALALAGQDVDALLIPALAGLAVLVTLLILFGLILRSESNAERIGAWADRIAGTILKRFRPGTEPHLAASVLKLRHDIVGLVSRRWLAITVANFSVSLGQFGILAVALWLVSADSYSILVVYGSWAISQLGILLPVTPGGLGTVDAAMIGLLTANGVDQGDATAAALLWRATYYFPQILIGLISIFVWRWQVAKQRQQQSVAQG